MGQVQMAAWASQAVPPPHELWLGVGTQALPAEDAASAPQLHIATTNPIRSKADFVVITIPP
jgi:hypothetical protein